MPPVPFPKKAKSHADRTDRSGRARARAHARVGAGEEISAATPMSLLLGSDERPTDVSATLPASAAVSRPDYGGPFDFLR